MALQITIPGIRCGEETDGVGDDEIVLIAAVVPVDTIERVWTYADRWTDCQYRFLPDVSTGDSYVFANQTFGPDGPIVFTQDLRNDRAVEIWLLIAEVDGGGQPTFSRASAGYNEFYGKLAERVKPGALVGSTTPTPNSRRTWRQPALGGNYLQTIGFDVFTINLAQPLAGAMDEEYPSPDIWQLTAESGAERIYKNPKDGWFSETRTYRHDGLDARYTVDVEYRLD